MESKILIQPVISEKSYSKVNAENKYTFIVPISANKIEIGKAVEKTYKVKVENVNTVTKPGKMKRDWVRYKQFRRADVKKAIVQLKKGDKIDEILSV